MRIAPWLAVCCLYFTGGMQAEEKLPTVDDYLGRWNILIHDTGDSFFSSWLKVARVEGDLKGWIVWKWGGETPVGDVVVEDGKLRFRRGEERYIVQRIGDEIRGIQMKGGGQKVQFTGRPAPEMCDPAGTWKVRALSDSSGRAGEFTLKMKGDKITGEAVDPDGNSYSIQDAKLDGYHLSFSAAAAGDDKGSAQVKCELRGDVLVGTVEMKSSEGAEERSERIEGKRERKWGEPVALLEGNSLDGWTRRDPKRKFDWSVSGGVLENHNPPVDDIVSEKKFRDFRMHAEYKVAEHVNSGIYLRGRYELQILGDTARRPHGNMAVYSRLSPAKNPMNPLDEWQSVDVTFIGRWLTVVLNGEVVHDNAYLDGITGGAIDPWEGEPGPLLLQGDHGKIRFRNIVVTPAK